MTPRMLFRSVAVAEAVTWTLLIIGMFLKYVTQTTDIGVSIGGALHGFVFLAFVATSVLVGVNQRWSTGLIAGSVATAVVPYATIPMDRYLEGRSLLSGPWRRDASPDARPIDRALAWLLSHPALLGVTLVVGVTLVFAALLIVGPPGGGE